MKPPNVGDVVWHTTPSVESGDYFGVVPPLKGKVTAVHDRYVQVSPFNDETGEVDEYAAMHLVRPDKLYPTEKEATEAYVTYLEDSIEDTVEKIGTLRVRLGELGEHRP